jgi:hypothetical protein
VRALLQASVLAAVVASTVALAVARDPFAFFTSAFEITGRDRAHLDAGEVIARVLPAQDGELAVFAASRLDAAPEALVAWTEAIDLLKRGPYVPAIGRFSDPPVLADLDALALEPSDLESIRRCQPGDCGLKLGAGDIQSFRLTLGAVDREWQQPVQQQFREMLLERVQDYRPEPVALLLGDVPAFDYDAVASFFYWSKEDYGAGKPVIAVTHVQIVRPRTPGAPEVLSISRQVFATHYRNASVGYSAIVRGAQGQRYLVYVNRSELDVLGGFFGGLKRKLIEGRFKSEAAAAVVSTRARLEGPLPEAAGRDAPPLTG